MSEITVSKIAGLIILVISLLFMAFGWQTEEGARNILVQNQGVTYLIGGLIGVGLGCLLMKGNGEREEKSTDKPNMDTGDIAAKVIGWLGISYGVYSLLMGAFHGITFSDAVVSLIAFAVGVLVLRARRSAVKEESAIVENKGNE